MNLHVNLHKGLVDKTRIPGNIDHIYSVEIFDIV